MPITVECPACEQTFRISSKYKNRKGRCPACDCSFIADESVVTQVSETLRAHSKPAAPPSLPLPTAVKANSVSTLKSGLKPPSIPKLSDSGEAIDVDENDVVDSDSSISDRSFTHAAEQSLIADEIRSTRKVKSALIAGAAIGILLLGVGVALGLSGVFNKQTVADNKEPPKKILTDDEIRKTSTKNKETPQTKKNGEVKADEKPTMVGMDTLHRTWSQVHPYLLKLDIVSTTGNHTATGILIDSRGWVATSYNAIKDAISVKTSMAASSIDEGPAINEQLSDLARGVIAVDPAHDIAIISVNRTLVQNVSDIAIEFEEPLVGAQRLIFCRAPQDGRRLWITDSKVASRPLTNELTEANAAASEKLGYQVDENFRWIIHRRPFQEQFAGAALLNKSGQLVGMGVAWKANSDKSFAIPISTLIAVRDKVIRDKSYEKIKLFKNAGMTVAANKTGNGDGGADDVNVDTKSFDFPIFQQVNKTIDDSNAAGWLATDRGSLTRLKSFAESLIAAESKIKKKGGDKKAVEASLGRLSKTVDNIQKKIDAIEILAQKSIANSNQLMLTEAKKVPESPVVFYATVYRPSIFGPILNNKKTVMFTIDGTKQLLITPVTDNHFDLRPGTRWILVGRVNKAPEVLVRAESTNNDPNEERCLYVDVTYVFEIVPN